MQHAKDKIHIMPHEGWWQVEDQAGYRLALEVTQSSAVATAKALARKQHLDTVILHDGDGVTEPIAVPPL